MLNKQSEQNIISIQNKVNSIYFTLSMFMFIYFLNKKKKNICLVNLSHYNLLIELKINRFGLKL